MANGISLHIGLNNVDPDSYDGWNDALDACLADADDMESIAQQQGFQATKLTEGQATRDAVKQGVSDAAANLVDGDFFLLTYAGHGGQVLDVSKDEKDNTDETWCLWDGQLIDDELRALWASFQAGVRILMISDSCHSGSVSRAIDAGQKTAMDHSLAENKRVYGTEHPKFRYMPRPAAIKVYRASAEFYNDIQQALPNPPLPISARVRLISGCQDDQLSGEGFGNGLFTSQLKQVWDDGKFEGGYDSFHKAILAGMPEDQQPNNLVFGGDDATFDAQRPFTI